MMQRALAASLLARKKVIIENISECADALAAMEVCQRLGVKFKQAGSSLHVDSSQVKLAADTVLDCGESGLCLRMFAPIVALFGKPVTLTGRGSLLKRPMGMLEEPLRNLGVEVETNAGFLPLKINGSLKGEGVEVDGAISSQFVTGLLLALPNLPNSTQLIVRKLKSVPYIDMTLDLLAEFGIKINHQDYQTFFIEGGQNYNLERYFVEGDWSGASFLLVGGAVAGEVTVGGLNMVSKQADRNIVDVLRMAGAEVILGEDEVTVKRGELKAFEYDATDSPDLAPPLVAIAACCSGKTIIRGTARLKYKESDRAEVLKKEFARLGVNIRVEENAMEVEGGQISGGIVEAHGDHRLAMALACAALKSTDKVVIEGAECVAKSYPGFFEDLAALGGNINE
jgi:3-phosphoshikimate 1-carboxyvinyltransferase